MVCGLMFINICLHWLLYRYVYDNLRQYCHDDRDLRLASSRQLVSLDESCRESVELAELLMEDGAFGYVVPTLI